MQTPQIVPSGHACGAEIVGVDLSAPGPLTAEALREAVREHLAVVVRGLPLADESLLALGMVFGTPEMQGVSVLNQQAAEVLKHVARLWGFDVHLDTVDPQGVVLGTLNCRREKRNRRDDAVARP